jgi:4-amino-4-deoxy-L-arabinose transferase-like glycosyltransferase
MTARTPNFSVDIIIPCRNESASLAENIATLIGAADKQLPWKYTITIVDSASEDTTLKVAKKLASKNSMIRIVRVDVPGRGLAIRKAVLSSKATAVAYMDEDLSTNLNSIHALIKPLVKNSRKIVIGSRYHSESTVVRGKKRTLLSIGYSLMARLFLRIGIKDFQCGFKAMHTTTAQKLMSMVQSDEWFFDSELLCRAKDAGYDIQEIPVHWIEEPDSRVNILPTIFEFTRGIDRLTKTRKQKVTPERFVMAGLVFSMSCLLVPAFTMNGWANTYYTMAVQAGQQNWKAFFFGSLDSANFVTLDKPPFAVWVSSLSAKVFGFSSFSILLPHVIAGLVALLLVYITVRRYFGIKAAIVSAVSFMCMPIAIVVFRYNLPDSLMTAMLVASAYTFLRSLEKPAIRWMIGTGILIGFAFNTKMIQALIILPVMGLMYLILSHQKMLLRIRDLSIAGLAFFVSALWWPIAVWLIPAVNRPFIGGTANNSIWELIAGYNGLNRLTGNNWKQPTGELLGAGFGGKVGILRMFNNGFGSVIAWCIPLAIITALLFWVYYKKSTNRMRRNAITLWSSWIVLHAIIFSYTKGTIHPHYSAVLAPAIASLVGVAAWMFWSQKKQYFAESPVIILLVIVMATSATLMPYYFWKGRDWSIAITTITVCLALGGLGLFSWARSRQYFRLAQVSFIIILMALLFAPACSTVASSRTAQTGLIISAMPLHPDLKRIRAPEESIPLALQKYLAQQRGKSTWIASTATAYDSAAIQLATRQPVMTIGGFSGADNFVSLNQFKQYVREGRVGLFIVNRQQSSEIKRCGATSLGRPGLQKFPVNNTRLAIEKGCANDTRNDDTASTLDITNWAQLQKPIKQKDFGAWEVFDLR